MSKEKAIILRGRNFLASMQHVTLAISAILSGNFSVQVPVLLRGRCLSSPEGA